MIVSLLVAMDEKRGIGKDNLLPWRLSADLRRFKELTMSHHIIMGRKTFESIGRQLPGRVMVVITRNTGYHMPGCLIAHSLDEALALAAERGETEAFVIGGGEIFIPALRVADRIYLTLVHADLPVDVFFPAFSLDDWSVEESIIHPADEKNEYPSTFYLLVRKQ